jgi:hypothetical protein
MKKALVLFLILAVAGGVFAAGVGESTASDDEGWSVAGARVDLRTTIELKSGQTVEQKATPGNDEELSPLIKWNKGDPMGNFSLRYKNSGFQFDLGVGYNGDRDLDLTTKGAYTSSNYGFAFGTRIRHPALSEGGSGNVLYYRPGGTLPVLDADGDATGNTVELPDIGNFSQLRYSITDAWGYYKFLEGNLEFRVSWFGGDINPWQVSDTVLNAMNFDSLGSGDNRDSRASWEPGYEYGGNSTGAINWKRDRGWANRDSAMWFNYSNIIEGLSAGVRLGSPFVAAGTLIENYFNDFVLGVKYDANDLGISFMMQLEPASTHVSSGDWARLNARQKLTEAQASLLLDDPDLWSMIQSNMPGGVTAWDGVGDVEDWFDALTAAQQAAVLKRAEGAYKEVFGEYDLDTTAAVNLHIGFKMNKIADLVNVNADFSILDVGTAALINPMVSFGLNASANFGDANAGLEVRLYDIANFADQWEAMPGMNLTVKGGYKISDAFNIGLEVNVWDVLDNYRKEMKKTVDGVDYYTYGLFYFDNDRRGQWDGNGRTLQIKGSFGYQITPALKGDLDITWRGGIGSNVLAYKIGDGAITSGVYHGAATNVTTYTNGDWVNNLSINPALTWNVFPKAQIRFGYNVKFSLQDTNKNGGWMDDGLVMDNNLNIRFIWTW